MKINPVTILDYDEVYQLWLSIPGMGLNNIDDSREGFHKFLARNPSTCFVAEEDRQIVGIILSGHDGRRGYIYHAAVLPQYRRQGIGAALVAAALAALKAEEIIKVALVVFRKNEAGNRFWERQGFTERQDLVYRNKSLTEIQRIDT